MAGPLEFGTAGLRGVLGPGPNRMNRAVVTRTTAGLAAHLLASFADAAVRGVVVGYDARRMSREFAEQTARVLAGKNIVAYLFPTLCTTPQVAYATTQLGAVAGIMITASHNPPEYNGYKVYWRNGAQIISPQDKLISASIDEAPQADQIDAPSLDAAREKGLVRIVSDVITERYLRAIEQLAIHPNVGTDLRIVYTPMHGVGRKTALEALRRAGFSNVELVVEQADPNGEFPTVHFPNPEEPGALDLAFAKAKKVNADLIIANDPDADRLAVAVPKADGSGFLPLSGNQVGVLLANYFLAYNPYPPAKSLFVTTIVSSPMLGVMAQQNGALYEETLTGFKWIANRAMEVESETGATFVTGYEEALGYTVGTVVRDKDGVSAAAVFAEMAGYLRSQGRTILQELEAMYRKYGLFLSRQVSQWHKGVDGASKIESMMTALRQRPPKQVAKLGVLAVRDYQNKVRTDRDGKQSSLTLPASNVLAFELEGASRIIARPSGTEPKIKFYFDYREPIDANETLDDAQQRATAKLDEIVDAFLKIVGV